MILVRLALYLTLAAGFGLAWFGLTALPAGRRDLIAFRPWLLGGIAAALLLSFVWLALIAAQMGGTPWWPVDRDVIALLLGGTATGMAWMVRIAALAAAGLAAALAPRRSFGLAIVTAGGAIALSTLAWTGHGAMDDGAIGWLHLGADMLHLAAAGIWLGALLGLSLLVLRPGAASDATALAITHQALRGFAVTGTIVVAALIVTGSVNSWLLVGAEAIRAPAQTLYGRLLLAKLALFGAMLGLASLNRFRLTPGLARGIASADPDRALRGLRLSLLIEGSCAIAILALVAWLGTLEPPISGG